MRHRLLNYAIPVGAVVIGILGGVLPPPSLPVLWAVGILDALLAAWFLVAIYGWGRASLYAVIAVAFSFGAEYALISVGLLTHLTAPQLAGVAARTCSRISSRSPPRISSPVPCCLPAASWQGPSARRSSCS